jgi:anti-sigma factor RsiW
MKCEKTTLSLYLSQYQDGELDKRLREEIEAHLEECQACREELRRLGTVTGGIKRLPEIEAPQNFTAQVMAKVKQKQEEKPRWFALPSLVYSYVFVIFCLLGLMLNPNLKSPTQDPVGISTLSSSATISGYSALLAESQHLNLIEIQERTIEMVYNGEDEYDEN